MKKIENKVWNVWKTLTIGKGEFKDEKELEAALIEREVLRLGATQNSYGNRAYVSDNKINFFANNFLKFSSNGEQTISLVKVTWFDLGFTNKDQEVTFKQLCNSADKLGLEVCNWEVPWRLALALREKNDPKDLESWGYGPYVFMSKPMPFRDSLMTLRYKSLKSQKEPFVLWLEYFLYAGMDNYVHTTESFVFQKKQ